MTDDNGQLIIPEGETEFTTFQEKEVRRVMHNNEWWYSVVDVIGVLTESSRARTYWTDLKRKLKDEGASQLHDSIVQLKMKAADDRERLTDAIKPVDILRLVQSIPSPKAEPLKRWLAKTGYERIQEFQNPEIAVKRAMLDWKVRGFDDEWIDARIRTILTRKELTDEWKKRGVKEGWEYGALTNEISFETFEITLQKHKEIKCLPKAQNLKDHMTAMELILTMLGEKSTTTIARKQNAQGFFENKRAAKAGGKIAGTARRNLEKELGESVVSRENFLTERQKKNMTVPSGFAGVVQQMIQSPPITSKDIEDLPKD